MLRSREHAYEVIASLEATERLLMHLTIVADVAETLIQTCAALNVPIDESLVQVGAMIHDAGKVLHPEELNAKGNKHEAAGEILMLENGASAEQARFCRSHAQYDQISVSLEELVVALSDKLWKGRRVEALELKVIDYIATSLKKDRWDLFAELDNVFETIALEGDVRLQKTRNA